MLKTAWCRNHLMQANLHASDSAAMMATAIFGEDGGDGQEAMKTTKEMAGVVTIVQEGRFQMTDDAGASHLFILSHGAAAETDQLVALQNRQARITVRYHKAAGVLGFSAAGIIVHQAS
jgi:hypothetical protein